MKDEFEEKEREKQEQEDEFNKKIEMIKKEMEGHAEK